MTPEELLSLTSEQLRGLEIVRTFDWKENPEGNTTCSGIVDCFRCISCHNCVGCIDCTSCYRCLNCIGCENCIGILDDRNLRFVAWGIQLTEEQFEELVNKL